MKINRNEKIHRKISELSVGAAFNYDEEVYMLIVGIDAATQSASSDIRWCIRGLANYIERGEHRREEE